MVVRLGDARYALPVSAVQEVEHVPPITTVARAPGFVPGVVNLRGSALTLVDVAALLGIGRWLRTRDARMLVTRGDDPVAVVVDELQAMRRLSLTSISAALPALPPDVMRFVSGVHHDEDDVLVAVDIRGLLLHAAQAA
jgi:purine-binding chemotaxis protein CheW